MHQLHVRRRSWQTVTGVAVAGLALALAQAAPALAYDPADGREVLGAGVHVDAIYPEITEDGDLEVNTLTPDGVVDPESVALSIPTTDTSHLELPEGYEFLAPEGTEVWVSTEAQDQSVVWPGWSFEGIETGVLSGTVKINYDSFSYAGDSDDPAFAITQPGGFDGTKVTELIVPGSTFTTVSGEVGAHTHATWTFTAEGVYDIDFTVDATLADGTPLSDDVTVRFLIGDVDETDTEPVLQEDPPATDGLDGLTIVPSKVDAEYFVGQTVSLSALSPDAAEDDTYRWHVTSADGTETVDEEQTTNVFTTKPIRSLDGSSAYVERLDASGEVVETSEPQPIGVRMKEQTTTLTVTPDKDAYQVGDTAHFTSAQSPETDDEHYHWYMKLAGAEEYEWIPESRLADQDLEITEEMDGATITARLFNADHAVLAESEPIVLDVTGDGVVEAKDGLTISTDSESYTAGDTAVFTVDDASDDADVVWTVRKGGENVFSTLDATGPTLEQKLDADWAGAEVRAVVTDNGEASEGIVTSVSVAESDEDDAAGAESADSSGAAVLPWVIGGIVLLVIVAAIVIVIVRRRRSTDK